MYFRYVSMPHSRVYSESVKVRNKTAVSLKIIWTTYQIPQDEMIDSEYCVEKFEPEFGVMVDCHSRNYFNFCRLNITEYFGELSPCAFKVILLFIYIFLISMILMLHFFYK